MFPVAWALMENKTEQCYKDVLREFFRAVPQIRPITILGDYETAMRNAALEIYGPVNFQGCNTHLNRVCNIYISFISKSLNGNNFFSILSS